MTHALKRTRKKWSWMNQVGRNLTRTDEQQQEVSILQPQQTYSVKTGAAIPARWRQALVGRVILAVYTRRPGWTQACVAVLLRLTCSTVQAWVAVTGRWHKLAVLTRETLQPGQLAFISVKNEILFWLCLLKSVLVHNVCNSGVEPRITQQYKCNFCCIC